MSESFNDGDLDPFHKYSAVVCRVSFKRLLDKAAYGGIHISTTLAQSVLCSVNHYPAAVVLSRDAEHSLSEGRLPVLD
jgi:hypothetical protein